MKITISTVIGFAIIGMFVLALLSLIYAVVENHVRQLIVRKSNKLQKTFYQQCTEFMSEIQRADDFFVLLSVKKRIDSYMGERDFVPGEYDMKRKLYTVYYTRQALLVPSTEGLNRGTLKFY